MITWKKVSIVTTCTLITSLLSGKIPKETVEVSLQQGQEYSIELEANPSTGYSWNMLTHQPVNERWLELVNKGSGTTAQPEVKGKVGGNSKQKLTFKALKPTGTARFGVYLYYCRPWSGEIAKIKELSVMITEKE